MGITILIKSMRLMNSPQEKCCLAGSGITDGLLFDGVKFEKIALEQAVW